MIITNMALPRRTFLRGAGATLALPFLDAMVPALSAAVKPPTPRLGFFYVPNGTYLPNFHPAQVGKHVELSPILKPLEAVREHVTVVSGLSNKPAENLSEGGGPHTRVHAAWLSGVRPKRTEGADIQAGTTIDQIAAGVIGKDSPLNSLQIALDYDYVVGNCENGYSCVYAATFSWKTPTTPMPMESNPRAVFERLFGDGATAAERAAYMREDRSILDLALAEMKRLQARLGARDRGTVSDYLDSVREIEQRIQRAEQHNATSPTPVMEAPVGIPDSFDEHAKLMLDLTVLAFRADITRVLAFQVARELSGRTYPSIGVPDGHHTMSHHQMDAEKITRASKINAYHVSLFAYFLEKLRSIPDGDSNLLEQSLFMYGAGMGDSDHHTPVDLPIVVAGGAGGRHSGDRHLRCPLHTPFTNLGLTLLDKVGVEIDRVGDSTGRLTDL